MTVFCSQWIFWIDQFVWVRVVCCVRCDNVATYVDSGLSRKINVQTIVRTSWLHCIKLWMWGHRALRHVTRFCEAGVSATVAREAL